MLNIIKKSEYVNENSVKFDITYPIPASIYHITNNYNLLGVNI